MKSKITIYSSFDWRKMRRRYRYRVRDADNGEILSASTESYYNLKELQENMTRVGKALSQPLPYFGRKQAKYEYEVDA